MSEKVIRIWHGCRVVQVVAVTESGSSIMGATGGAHNSIAVDIEIDPWAGLIVDHNAPNSPVDFRAIEQAPSDELVLRAAFEAAGFEVEA